MIIFFSIIDNTTVRIYSRFESDSGDIGEGIDEIMSGEDFYGVPFEQFIANGSGKMEITACAPGLKAKNLTTPQPPP